MIETATILLRDAESGDDAAILVRYDSKRVALGVSLRSNGDVEVVMSRADANRVVDALRKALGDLS